MLKKIEFSANQLIIDGRAPQADDFEPVYACDVDKQIIKSGDGKNTREEVISIQKIKAQSVDGRFVTIYFEEGDKFPYPDKVVDVSGESLLVEDNPRAPEQIECDQQFFVVVDLKTMRIYVSDQRKRNWLIQWLISKTKKAVESKALMLQSEFVGKIKSVSEISFALESNLFNTTGAAILGTELVRDIYGFGADEATIILRYYGKRRILSKPVFGKIRQLVDRKSELKSLTIVGRTDQKFENIFNVNDIVSKITIDCELDLITQILDPNQVFDNLIGQLKENDKE